MPVSKEILESLNRTHLREPKVFLKNGKKHKVDHMGVYRADLEVIGHSWEFRRGRLKEEVTTLFGGREKECAVHITPKLICVVHVLGIDGNRRMIPIHKLFVSLDDKVDESTIPKTKKVKIINEGRKWLKIGETIPVRCDVWSDGFVENTFDVKRWEKRMVEERAKDSD